VLRPLASAGGSGKCAGSQKGRTIFEMSVLLRRNAGESGYSRWVVLSPRFGREEPNFWLELSSTQTPNHVRVGDVACGSVPIGTIEPRDICYAPMPHSSSMWRTVCARRYTVRQRVIRCVDFDGCEVWREGRRAGHHRVAIQGAAPLRGHDELVEVRVRCKMCVPGHQSADWPNGT